jgi:hypothetical protein
MTLQTAELPIHEPPAPAPDPPSAPEPTDATRYLCAGAYLDTTFRDRCLREVYYQNKRIVAPSYGFDVGRVLDACLRSRNLTIGRDVAIVATLATAAYLNWVSAAAVGTALICLRVTGAAGRLVRDYLARVRSGTAVDTTKSPGRGLVLLLGWAIAWIVFIVLASRVVSAAATTFTGARSISGGAALLVAPIVFTLPAVFALWKQKRVEEFTKEGRPPPPRDNARMREIADQQRGNTVVYSNFEPFIGAGDVVRSWGFAQRLIRTQPDPVPGKNPPTERDLEFEMPPFSAVEITGYVFGHLEALIEGIPEHSIPAMTVEGLVFLSDREYGEHRGLVTPPHRVAEIITNPTNPARYYIACQVVAWGGDVVTTVYIHLAVQGRSLYLEVTSTSLAPCNETYRMVDEEGGTGPRAWRRAATDAILTTPRTITRAPARLVGYLADATGRRGAGAAGLAGSRRRDHGARISVRQLGTRDKLRNFTQRQDIVKFQRLIERRVLAHVLDYLDLKGVDTTEHRAQRASVLNVHGGVNNWGTAQYDGPVAGRDQTTNPAPPAPAPGTR